MENQEKLAAVGTQDKGQRYTKQMNTAQYALDTTMHKKAQIT